MPFQATATDSFANILSKLNISLIFTTYQAGNVVIIGQKDGQLTQLVRNFERPMGIALHGDMMALASRLNVTVFKNDRYLAKTYPPKPDTYDAFYFPLQSNRTDFVDMHDLCYTAQGLIGVNTAFNCLSKIDGWYSFNPVWKPSFISEFDRGDRCHLNGMAVDEKQNIKYVTAFGMTNQKGGWRENKLAGGIVIDVTNNKIVLQDLAMPHSPRIYNGELYLLLSATEELVKADLRDGSYQVIAKVDGFIRGLTLKDDYAFIGISRLRHSHAFGDLDIANKPIMAGIAVVNIITGQIEDTISYQEDIEEIYDVHILNNIKRANIINFWQSIKHRALITPHGSQWIKEELEEQYETAKGVIHDESGEGVIDEET